MLVILSMALFIAVNTDWTFKAKDWTLEAKDKDCTL